MAASPRSPSLRELYSAWSGRMRAQTAMDHARTSMIVKPGTAGAIRIYHSTKPENIVPILKNGLLPQQLQPNFRQPRVSAFKDQYSAVFFRAPESTPLDSTAYDRLAGSHGWVSVEVNPDYTWVYNSEYRAVDGGDQAKYYASGMRLTEWLRLRAERRPPIPKDIGYDKSWGVQRDTGKSILLHNKSCTDYLDAGSWEIIYYGAVSTDLFADNSISHRAQGFRSTAPADSSGSLPEPDSPDPTSTEMELSAVSNQFWDERIREGLLAVAILSLNSDPYHPHLGTVLQVLKSSWTRSTVATKRPVRNVPGVSGNGLPMGNFSFLSCLFGKRNVGGSSTTSNSR